MQIRIQIGEGEREIEIGRQLLKWLKWSWVLVLLVAATMAAGIYVLVWMDPLRLVDLEVRLNKELNVKIDSKVPVTARIDQVLEFPVKETVPAKVFVDQTFTVPVDETFNVPLDLTVPVKVDQDLHVVAQVPLKVVLPVNDTLTIDLPMVGERKVAVKGNIPVNITVPVDQTFHVKDELPVRIKDSVSLRVKRDLQVPIKTEVSGEVKLDTRLQVPVAADIRADVYIRETVHGEIDQKFILDRDQIHVRRNPGRTGEMKEKVFSKLPDPVKESLEKGSKEGKGPEKTPEEKK